MRLGGGWRDGRRGLRGCSGGLGVLVGAVEVRGRGGGEAGMLTEEHVLDNYGLLRELVEDVVRSGETLLLYARPREVDVEEEEQDAEADDGRLGTVSL